MGLSLFPYTRISLPPIFVNKDLLEHSHARWSVPAIVLQGQAEQLPWRPSGLQSLKYFYSQYVYRKSLPTHALDLVALETFLSNLYFLRFSK